ncbi:MAG: gliding motility-associated C-terminal domain-containing protein [Bacteroidetes bacterium]|nr:gliding motility-associated C-terminal domain-containing protein [Bacteroidota bacterium]
MYFKFDVAKTGTLEWLATPSGNINLDWEVLDITGGCPGVSIACNYVYTPPGGQITGMQDTSTTPCSSGHICQSVIVTAGNTYVIHINNASWLPGVGYTLSWGGTFEMAPYSGFAISSATGCGSLTTTVLDSSVGVTTYNWIFGNGNTFAGPNPPAQTYIATGTYLISLVASNSNNGCSHTSSASVTVYDKPTADFIFTDTTICLTQTTTAVYVGNADTTAAYNWDFSGATIVSGSGQGPITVQWQSAGTFQVSLYVVKNGCSSDTVIKNVYVSAPPDSNFNMQATVCTGDTIMIAYTGIVNNGTIYTWNTGNAFVVGGNGNDTLMLTWSTPQLDSIGLQVNDAGCISALTYQLITVNEKPTSSFFITDTACTNQPVLTTYTGTGTIAGLYNWIFGGATAVPGGTVQGPHALTFATSGTYIVGLAVLENGCISKPTTDTIYIQDSPDANFSLSDDTLCTGETVTITYTGSTPGATYFWDFDGGNIISGSNLGPFDIDWATSGPHIVSLIMINSNCNDTLTDTIYVGITPVADAGIDLAFCSLDSGQLGAPIIPLITYAWSPAVSLSSTSVAQPYCNLQNTGNTALVQSYYLTVSNTYCSATDTVTVTVTANQEAVIGSTTLLTQCISNNSFDFTINAPLVQGAGIIWDFTANAAPANANTATVTGVTYNQIGTYIVSLITSANGCPPDTDTVTVTILDAPTVDFGADTILGCPPLTTNFTDSSSAPPGSTYLWNFGNGDTSSLQNPSYTYTVSGVYHVSLTVTSPNGCSTTYTDSSLVNVTQTPIPGLDADPLVATIANPLIQFINTTQYGDSCLIDFGDGTTHLGCDNVLHTYQDTGTYIVWLYTTSAGGCKDSISIVVEINPFYALYLPNAFTPNEDGFNDVLKAVWEGVDNIEFSLFNRLGQMVFNTKNKNFQWRGTDFAGKRVQQGAYAYTIFIQDDLGKRHYRQGIINVVY